MVRPDPLVTLPLTPQRLLAPQHQHSGLARHLDVDLPLFAPQARGLDGIDELPTSVADMASDNLHPIREVQSADPYYLLGWSFGGTVAHEMARQLQAMGEEAALLAMLDSHPTGRSRHAGQPSAAAILSLALDGLVINGLGTLADTPPANAMPALGGEQLTPQVRMAGGGMRSR
ncbi:thioesterase domain-containing protein [Streptomyces chartreusis]